MVCCEVKIKKRTKAVPLQQVQMMVGWAERKKEKATSPSIIKRQKGRQRQKRNKKISERKRRLYISGDQVLCYC